MKKSYPSISKSILVQIVLICIIIGYKNNIYALENYLQSSFKISFQKEFNFFNPTDKDNDLIPVSKKEVTNTLPSVYYGVYRGVCPKRLIAPNPTPEYKVSVIIKKDAISIAEYMAGLSDVIFTDGTYSVEESSTETSGSIIANIKGDIITIKYFYKNENEIELYIENWCTDVGITLKKEIKSEVNLPKEKDSEINDGVYFTAVEQMPEPIGGLKTIQSNIDGKVYILVFINEEGNVTKAEIIKGLDKAHDDIAIETILNTKFKPGKQRGKPVKVQVSIPVYFELGGQDQR